MAKILIVDRDRHSAKRMAQSLQQAGHTCALCARGKEALDIIDNEALDLLVLETMLPDISGFEVCRRVRSSSELFHLPIVFTSEMNNPEEVEHALSQGADDFISKPVDPTLLIQHVNNLVDASARAEYLEPITGLPDAEETRRRIQLRISRGDRFGLVYVELLGLRRLGSDFGADGRDKALRHLGRALRLTGEGLAEEGLFIGHMGGGFFLCMLPPAETEVFSAKLLKSWRKHRPMLREALGMRDDLPQAPSDFLDLMICTTAREDKDACSAQDLLDTLSRIRRSVRDETGGVHLDRRHWHAASGTGSGGAGV